MQDTCSFAALALIDEVADSKSEIVITRRGKPVARLVPIEAPQEHERRLLERWCGKGEATGERCGAARAEQQAGIDVV